MDKNQEFLRKLILGSENMDRMRKEIEMVIGMITSILFLGPVVNYSVDVGGGLVWVFNKRLDGMCSISLTSDSYRPHYSISFLLGSHRQFIRDKEVSVHDVQKVHKSLSILVNELYDDLSEFRQCWKAILAAADYEF